MARKINNSMTDALMLVGGGIVGAGMALLLAPQAGRKTCRELVRFGRKIGKAGDNAVRDFTASVTNLADSVGAKAAGILHR